MGNVWHLLQIRGIHTNQWELSKKDSKIQSKRVYLITTTSTKYLKGQTHIAYLPMAALNTPNDKK